MKSSDLTPERIRRSKQHVVYEWQQLEYCKQRLDKMRQPHDQKFLRTDVSREEHYVMVSAFVLHARSLVAFFENRFEVRERRDENTDVLAGDFFVPPKQWIQPSPAKGELWLRDQKEKMHKLVAHITYSRDDPDYAVPWEIDALFDYLSEVWQVFRDTASPALWTSDIQDLADWLIGS